jgi:YaiO family outer membrane protein
MKCRFLLFTLLAAQAAWAGVYEQGLEAKNAGRHEEAAGLLRKATQAQPSNVEAWLHYGMVLGWQNKHDEALTALRQGLRRKPGHYDLLLAEATVLGWKKDYAAADERLAEMEQKFPGNQEVALMRGRIAVWRGDLAEGRRRYEAILQKDPNQVEVLMALGDIEMEEWHVGQAKTLYERALAVKPSPELQQRLEAATNQTLWRIDTSLSGSTFARQERDRWWGISRSYTYKFRGWDTWLRVETGERFNLQDVTWEIGTSGLVMKGIRTTVYGGFTPDASYSARWYADAAMSWRLYESLGPLGRGDLLTEARWADYTDVGVRITRLGWQQQVADAWTVNAHWLHFSYDSGMEADGWLMSISWEPKERWQFRIGAGQAVESLTNQTLQQGRSIRSWTIFASMVMPVSDFWHVRLDLEREEVQNGVIRYGMAAGCGYRF